MKPVRERTLHYYRFLAVIQLTNSTITTVGVACIPPINSQLAIDDALNGTRRELLGKTPRQLLEDSSFNSLGAVKES